jgi:hypothetical protein
MDAFASEHLRLHEGSLELEDLGARDRLPVGQKSSNDLVEHLLLRILELQLTRAPAGPAPSWSPGKCSGGSRGTGGGRVAKIGCPVASGIVSPVALLRWRRPTFMMRRSFAGESISYSTVKPNLSLTLFGSLYDRSSGTIRSVT